MHSIFCSFVLLGFALCLRACVYDNIFLSYCPPELAAALVDFSYGELISILVFYECNNLIVLCYAVQKMVWQERYCFT